jgi:hypothetical protein
MSLDDVRRVADAVLYEGYVLYPYRASAQKNRSRWQFGVLMPPAYAAADPSESTTAQAECVFEHAERPEINVLVRFLQVQRRTATGPEAGAPGAPRAPEAPEAPEAPGVWDEAVEREIHVAAAGAMLFGAGVREPFAVPGGEDREATADAQVVRTRRQLTGVVDVRAAELPGPWQAARLTIRVQNQSGTGPPALASRDQALPSALVAVHMIITVSGGAFVSMTDPPEWAAPAAVECENIGCWPVLAGPAGSRNTTLAAPIILPDYPEIARESAGELYDGTEIDEILTLRTLALTDEEKDAARATDPRAAALIDRVESMDADALRRLHGTIRDFGPSPGATQRTPPGTPAADGDASVPWWDPEADESVSPSTDSVLVAGQQVARGSRVTLRPGARRADAQDMFLAGRTALVEAVLLDVDNTAYLAVTLEDDPAADLHAAHGRFLYFMPDEVEPA